MISSDLGYILHSRPYRETSYLQKVITREHGLVSLVHRGARRGRSRPQPFNLLQLSWSGRTDLKTLKTVEMLESRVLVGKTLYIGFYLNEVLVRVMPDAEPSATVFDRYHHLLTRVVQPDADEEVLLRSFEFALLEDMGYGFALDVDGLSGRPLRADGLYRFDVQQGLLAADADGERGAANLYPGRDLLAMAAMDYSTDSVRTCAKRLMREALVPLLGSKPLMSRELYKGHVAGPGPGE